ncbi:MAG: hypothetical protein U1F57_01160 [bacterium]
MPITKATNHCGEVIQVGQSYRVNEVSPENACKERNPGISVKVTEIRDWGNGVLMAKVDFPRNPKDDIYLQWIVIDRLYRSYDSSTPVARNFTPASRFTSQIRKA